jgi:hypothetical protein
VSSVGLWDWLSLSIARASSHKPGCMTNFLAWAKASYIREKRIINLHTSGTHFEHAYTIISKVDIVY